MMRTKLRPRVQPRKSRTRLVARAVLLMLSVTAFLPTTLFSQSPVGPYLYVVSPSWLEDGDVYFSYDAAFGLRSVRPFGEDGVEQRVGVIYGLSDRVSLVATAGAWVEAGSAVHLGSLQAEVMADLVRGRSPLSGVSVGAGFLREYLGVNVLLARVAAGSSWRRWLIHGNALLEKPFAKNRDPVDLITSAGCSYALTDRFRVGIEAIGEDLEGFFEPEEAEGGAKLLVGPSIQWKFSDVSHLRIGGGPIFYMTQSPARSNAPRLLPSSSSGFALRASLTHAF